MVSNIIQAPRVVYYEDNSPNKSFMKMHYFLKARGIKNNKFFLLIYDPDLIGVNPRDPNLSIQMKMKILKECMTNYWYFIRNVVSIKEEGGAAGMGSPYQLHRANLAMNYLFVYNISQFVEMPRQFGKTVGALAWYLWVFNFGATNTRMIFSNKKHEDSKRNLDTLRDFRDALPDYLKLDHATSRDGKVIRVPNSRQTCQNPFNKNIISTLAGARTPALAEGAGRGCTTPILWYDEFSFLPYNDIVYTAAAPAYSRASENAKKNGSPYGMLITTTPGDLTTREGQFANRVRENATVWSESYYDFSYDQLMRLIDSNTNSKFVYMRYTYQMLGRGAQYFDEMVKLLETDWPRIQREVNLVWAKTADNNPFNREDLEIIGSQTKDEPRYTLLFGKAGQFQMKFWDQIPMNSLYPLIIGVDVSSGTRKDASAITVVDSQTTKVIATFRNNFITMPELADVIYQFVTGYAKNAIVAIENNGGFGSSVLQMLLRTSIKKNLYYEIKDKIDEELFDGISVKRRARKCKVYGCTSSKTKRNALIELLHQRVQHHRDKFATKELYNELCTMVVKPNGKTEHADDAHDDLIFSYLWALYVFYHGEELATRYHMIKTEIYTDDHYDETSYSLEEEYGESQIVDPTIFKDPSDTVSTMIDEQLQTINKAKSITMEDFYKQQMKVESDTLAKIALTKYGREAISKAYNLPLDYLEKQNSLGFVDIGDDINRIMYGDDIVRNNLSNPTLTGNLAQMFDSIR